MNVLGQRVINAVDIIEKAARYARQKHGGPIQCLTTLCKYQYNISEMAVRGEPTFLPDLASV